MLSQSIPSKKGWFLKSSIPFCPSLCSILQQSLQHNKTVFTLHGSYTDTYTTTENELSTITWHMYSLKNFTLLDSPIIGRVTATAWSQLLRARNSPFPNER